jgi:hypothetical protein
LTAVQYPGLGPLNFQEPTPVQLNDMYSYTQAGLPATKRLQVNQNYYWTTSGGYGHHQIMTANLDTALTYNNAGRLTAMTYPSTIRPS